MGRSASKPSDNLPLYIAGPKPPIPLSDIRKQDAEIQIPSSPPSPHPDRHLTLLTLLLALLVFSAITGGTTYALVLDIQHRIAFSAGTIDAGDRRYWMQQARKHVYDACYYGCNGCRNPRFSYKACAKSAELNVTGVVCDGNVMWNWKERYPIACLEAMADVYKQDAFRSAKRGHMKRLGLLTLTILGGIVGAAMACGMFWSCVEKYRRRKAVEAERRAAWPRDNQSGPPPPPSSSSWETDTSPPSPTSKVVPTLSPKASSKKKPRRTLGWGKLPVVALAALPGKAAAYPCTGYDEVSYQYFVDSNRTVYGVVYGWISNCVSGRKWDYSNVSPADYVSDILPSIVGCGFELVDAVEGNTNLRVANPWIERGWRVRISVNGYNVTSSMETDGSVQCLHDIGKGNK